MGSNSRNRIREALGDEAITENYWDLLQAKEGRRDAQRLARQGVFIEKSTAVHNGYYDYSKVRYTANNVKVTVVCPVHGDFQVRPNLHSRGRGCPKCKRSKLELRVAGHLDARGIPYVEQWTDHDCVYKYRVRFDFWIPSQGLIIEADGEFHRQPVKFPGMSDEQAYERWQDLMLRDKFKDSWAASKGIWLVRLCSADEIDGFFSV